MEITFGRLGFPGIIVHLRPGRTGERFVRAAETTMKEVSRRRQNSCLPARKATLEETLCQVAMPLCYATHDAVRFSRVLGSWGVVGGNILGTSSTAAH